MNNGEDIRKTLARLCEHSSLQRTIFPDGVIGDCEVGDGDLPTLPYTNIIFSSAIDLERNVAGFPKVTGFNYLDVLRSMNGFRFFGGLIFGYGFRPPPNTIMSPFVTFSIITANLEHAEIAESFGGLVIGGAWVESPERELVYLEEQTGKYLVIDVTDLEVLGSFNNLTRLVEAEFERSRML